MRKGIKTALRFFIRLSWLPFHSSNALATGRKGLATALPGQGAGGKNRAGSHSPILLPRGGKRSWTGDCGPRHGNGAVPRPSGIQNQWKVWAGVGRAAERSGSDQGWGLKLKCSWSSWRHPEPTKVSYSLSHTALPLSSHIAAPLYLQHWPWAHFSKHLGAVHFFRTL